MHDAAVRGFVDSTPYLPSDHIKNAKKKKLFYCKLRRLVEFDKQWRSKNIYR